MIQLFFCIFFIFHNPQYYSFFADVDQFYFSLTSRTIFFINIRYFCYISPILFFVQS